nr:reverse transcriptase domain-containing protein [Tanacetum cinerariifolium]GEY01549.1 reverse transcriptase domain-containing protein [Tanacetum cinerariifolium]
MSITEIDGSVPKEPSRSVLKEPTRSVLEEPSRSVLGEPTRLVLEEPSRSVPEEPTRSSDVFSQPPTSHIKDAFSSNFPDYVPASPRKTYSSSSNNSLGLVPIASLTLLLFHDDPYIKAMHAYYAKESPIPLSVIMPPSPMLSPMFNPQEFLLPEELLPPKKRDQTELQKTRAQVTKLQRKQLGQNNKIALAHFRITNLEQIIKEIQACHPTDKESLLDAAVRQLVADSITTALEAQAANMANADNTNRNPKPREVHVARKCSYKEFMSCQPFSFKEEAYTLSWVEFMKLLIKKYCLRTEVQKMEENFYHLTMKGNDLKTYVKRFQELATLCPTMVSDSEKMMEAFIGGLP